MFCTVLEATEGGGWVAWDAWKHSWMGRNDWSHTIDLPQAETQKGEQAEALTDPHRSPGRSEGRTVKHAKGEKDRNRRIHSLNDSVLRVKLHIHPGVYSTCCAVRSDHCPACLKLEPGNLLPKAEHVLWFVVWKGHLRSPCSRLRLWQDITPPRHPACPSVCSG